MPIPFMAQGAAEGISSIPYALPALKTAVGVWTVAQIRRYFGGAKNPSERVMHSKVVMITGGTSGIGAAVVSDLASRGAQIILLTQHSPSDPFIVDYIEDLRSRTNNQLIYAEQVNLSSLHSVRLFATKWIDNTPPRRLDMIILCANTLAPSAKATSRISLDGLNEEWQVNYLANYHLLSILSPAIRAQPPDRDVRIIFTTCSSYMGGKLDAQTLEATTPLLSETTQSTTSPQPSSTSTSTSASASTSASTTKKKNKKANKPIKPSPSPAPSAPSSPFRKSAVSSSTMFAASKLSLMIFARSFQQHLLSYQPPKTKTSTTAPPQPSNTRVLVVDPSFSRTPGTRRWLTGGSLWGLLIYIITWPIWWLILKSPEQGAQSILMAAMEARFSGISRNTPGDVDGRKIIGIEGGTLLKECRERPILREEVMDDRVGKELWEFSQRQIEVKEKEAAIMRALEKQERIEREKMEEQRKKDKGKENDVEKRK